MRGDETPGRIVTNFRRGVGVHDVITCADLYYDDRLRGFGVAGGQILAFSIDLLRHSYNTLALPCESVMTRSHPRMCLFVGFNNDTQFQEVQPPKPKRGRGLTFFSQTGKSIKSQFFRRRRLDRQQISKDNVTA